MRMLVILILTVLISGCSGLQIIESRIVNGIDAYCDKSTSERAGVRAIVNEKLSPNKIRVTCFGDEIEG